MTYILSRSALALVALAGLGSPFVSAAPLTVNLTDDPTALAQAILGGGITIVGTPTLSSQPGQTGTFSMFDSGPFTQTGGNSGQFMLASGAILSTGIASGAEGSFIGGPNFDASGAGDPQLSALSGMNTFDSAVLTIQFMSVNPVLFLNYVFASGEYPGSIGSFADVFGIFVNGTNAAVVPGTTIPVSVSSVNGNSNSNLFTQNSTPATPFNFGGATVLLTARANVFTNQVNTLQLSIADTLDGSVDSAVFIQGGSLTSVPEPGGLLLLPAGAALLGVLRVMRRRSSTLS